MKKIIASTVAALTLSLGFCGTGHAYYAERGDTLSQIAKWHEMSFKDIVSLNPHIKDPNHIKAGDYIITRSKAPERDAVAFARSLQEVTAYKDKAANFPYEVDSAGWVKGIYKKFGIELPETGQEQAVTGLAVDFDHLEIGDLMFFSTRKDKIVTHVGIYMGENLFISNFDAKNDVEIMTTWGAWAREYFLYGARYKI